MKLFSVFGECFGLLGYYVLQFSTEDLVKEVENSIAEFKRQKQEYDEERVKEQVYMHVTFVFVNCYCFLFWLLHHYIYAYAKLQIS